MDIRADNLIYYALTLSAKKGSYAKLQIVAACHRDAVPCVLVNEGRKLFQMFQGLFTMTNLHQASLPTVRAEFYATMQLEHETILAYSSRVDIIVATLAKLGEKVSPGAWIYALGNGLRKEYKESKDGILYNKLGFDSVMSVKTKLLSEEAVLTSKDKKSNAIKATKEKHDEIALKLKDIKLSAAKATKEAKDKAAEDQAILFVKGKGGKGLTKGKGRGRNNWTEQTEHDPYWDNQWNGDAGATWAQPAKGKRKGKPGYEKPFDPQGLWCNIHQKYGHSTDWCYENPNRTGGKPTPPTRPWCDSCNSYGHTSTTCWANPSGPTAPTGPTKEKGKSPPTKGKGGKGQYDDKQWKSPNFPAAYTEQATPALHEKELSSVCVDECQSSLDLPDDYNDDEIAAEIDLYFIAFFK